jgi:hypothetical protein
MPSRFPVYESSKKKKKSRQKILAEKPADIILEDKEENEGENKFGIFRKIPQKEPQ